LKLLAIANRGVKVYPGGFSDTFTVDHWRCRFASEAGEGNAVTHSAINALLTRFDEAGLDVIKTENLYNFDGSKGYSA
ncbi:MAG TPA: NADP-dependent isocitrate dehydrogenase, partial [Blastocatellia bacterium]|nr:NADP-dependent isocitrate dehydrogenase [Blastocatellia bacterium]